MDLDIMRIIGRLEEFQESTDSRLSRIEDKVDHLVSWKFKLVGGTIVISVLATVLIEIFYHN